MKYKFVKIGAYTPKIKVCDIQFNVKNIKEGIIEGEKEKTEILVFPELCVTGSTCGDLFLTETLINGAYTGLIEIVKSTIDKKMLVFVGLPINCKGKIYDSVAVINNGRVLCFIPKTNVIGSFNCQDGRYFSSGKGVNEKVDFLGEEVPFSDKIILTETSENYSVGVEIGEDNLLNISPSLIQTVAGASIIVNPSAKSEYMGRIEKEKNRISELSDRLICSYITANAGEGESTTDKVFSGSNLIYEKGELLNESKPFNSGLITSEADTTYIDFSRKKAKYYSEEIEKQNDFITVKFDACSDLMPTRALYKTPFLPFNDDNLELQSALIIQAEGLKKRIEHVNADSVVLGLSGGLDSTLALIVSSIAVEKIKSKKVKIICATMPCFGTTDRTKDNSVKLAKCLGAEIKKIEIKKAVERHLKDIKHEKGVYDSAYENSQARERTQVLMDLANMKNGLVVGTGDLSEIALGFATYNGDQMSMYGVNGSIPKTLVRKLVEYYKDKSKGKLKAVLADILDTPVSPELLPKDEKGNIKQKTEDIVGPYLLHDFFLYNFLVRGYSPKKMFIIASNTFKGEFSEEEILKWLKLFVRRFFTQEFKRSCMPDGVKATKISLSPRGGLFMPSDSEYVLYMNELEDISIK